MTIETATYLDDLSAALPGTSDFRVEGDDHLRLLKSTLKATFPGMGGRARRVQNKTGTYTAVLRDNTSILVSTGALALGLTTAATLGNGWEVWVDSTGGVVTITPAGSEQINNAASLVLPIGKLARIICDGGNFKAYISDKLGGFETGTRMLFQQTTTPSGWTKETNIAYNDMALRLVTGTTVVNSGTVLFSGVFTADGVRSTGMHTLTVAEMPSHVHTQVGSTSTGAIQGGAAVGDMFATNSGPEGGDQPHSHALNGFNIAYCDVIIGVKD